MRPSYLLYPAAAVVSLLALSSCGPGNTPPKVYDLGSRIEAGHIVYTVFETQWLAQIGAGDTARVPGKRFFLVRLSAVNSGGEEVFVPNMILKDDQGNTVEELSDGDQIPQWIGYARRVKPADSISGNVAFDAEPRHYKLQLTDENGEKMAIVDLPLNFNAEAPQVSVPNSRAPASGFRSPDKK
jgi:hypothetical protein